MDVLIGWPGGDLTGTLRLVGIVIFIYAFVLWVASVLWAYKDIRSRTRDPIAQGVGVSIAALFPLVGLPVYFVLRPSETLAEAYARGLEQEAILSDLHAISSCPNCRRPVQDEFQVCAHCATPLRQPCQRCDQLLQFSWRHCPYCATPREAARPARAAAAAPAAAPA
ncbi:MAG: zinc ribbon domain-containing protein, partial [Chloroflexi bacterium]|nr:zinc ribbon domain-containing protein [Chloroflexota bacterium]